MSWKFWKKDDLALPELTASYPKDTSMPSMDLSQHFEASSQSMPPPPQMNSMPSSFSGYTPPQSYSMPVGQPVQEHTDISKDLQVITAKLDTIRAQLEMLNTRVANLEQTNNQVQPKRPWY